MGARLTHKQKQQIIADRAEGLSLRKIADKHGVSCYAVRCALNSDPRFAQKITQKKEQAEKDILKQLEDRTAKVVQIIDLGMDALLDPRKYERAGAQAIATTLGILIDKYTSLAQVANSKGGNNELLQSLLDLERRGHINGD